jgi:hypothetical protein
MQHVVVATTDGILHEMHWNQYTHVTSPQPLKRSPGSAPVTFPGNIHSLSGFYTCDDHYQHVIVATEDGRLHEVYFTGSQHVNARSPLLLDTLIRPGPNIGQAGFYSPAINPMRVVTVGGADSHLHQVAWSASIDPFEWNPAPQFSLQGVAAIAGFYDQDDQSGNVIVAMEEGDVIDIHSSGAGGSTTDFVTTFFWTKDFTSQHSPRRRYRGVLLAL